jgi:hypothetical protein
MNGAANLGIAALLTLAALGLVALFIFALGLSSFVVTSRVFSLIGRKHRHDRWHELQKPPPPSHRAPSFAQTGDEPGPRRPAH